LSLVTWVIPSDIVTVLVRWSLMQNLLASVNLLPRFLGAQWNQRPWILFPILNFSALFFVAVLAEIGGGYLMWRWYKEKKTVALASIDKKILFICEIALGHCSQPSLEECMHHIVANS
jgi:hypothetical protein